jgi:hypothetical protein
MAVLETPQRLQVEAVKKALTAASGDQQAQAELVATSVEVGSVLLPASAAGKVRQGGRLVGLVDDLPQPRTGSGVRLADDLPAAPPRGRPPISAADEVLQQAAFAEAVGTGPEIVHGFKIFGNKGLVGTSYQRNILLLEAEKVGATSPRALLRAFEVEARAAGASELRIVGHAVVNEKLINPGLAQRLGYRFRQINGETIELVKPLGQ